MAVQTTIPPPPFCCLPPDGFMLYAPHIPQELLAKGGPATGKMDVNNTLGHFALINHQLKEVQER